MSFWSKLFSRPNFEGVTPNENPSPATPPSVAAPDYTPGNPEGFVYEPGDPLENRGLPWVAPSPWDGWPAEWSTPNWNDSRFNALADIAWLCIDMNATLLSTMPLFRVRGDRVIPSTSWMENPDPSIYTSWHEFAQQLFRDYLLGEAFVIPIQTGSDGFPARFRVIPPWSVSVEMVNGTRRYRIGGETGPDVTGEILHIRYDSSTDCARGRGPLEVAGARVLTSRLLSEYVRRVVETGGAPIYTLESEAALSEDDAQDLMNQWVASRKANLGAPPVFDNGVTLKTHMSMSPKDIAMQEIATFNEARIAELLRVPPFLVGLPNAGAESNIYSNVSQVHDQHDRIGLRPIAAKVMAALSFWALPSTQRVELQRDEYSRPDFATRAEAYERLVAIGVMSTEEVRTAERLLGDAPNLAAAALTGGEIE